MDFKQLARVSIPYVLTAGITLSVTGFAGNAFGIQDAVTDAATSVRRSIAQAVLSEDPAEFVATVQLVMRNFSGTAETASTASGAQEALASLVEEAERYQTPETRSAAFQGKLDTYVSSLQGQGVTDFVQYAFERIGADNARTEVIRALAGLSPADRQRAVEVMYSTLDDGQKSAAAQKMGLAVPTVCPEPPPQNPDLQKLLQLRQTAAAKNIDAVVQAAIGSLGLLDTYCERGFTGIIERRDDFAKIADSYCHSH